MKATISTKSVKKANYRIRKNNLAGFSADGHSASMRYYTMFGDSTLTVSTDKLIAAANKVMAQRSII